MSEGQPVHVGALVLKSLVSYVKKEVKYERGQIYKKETAGCGISIWPFTGCMASVKPDIWPMLSGYRIFGQVGY